MASFIDPPPPPLSPQLEPIKDINQITLKEIYLYIYIYIKWSDLIGYQRALRVDQIESGSGRLESS